jgi:hypothetical protein
MAMLNSTLLAFWRVYIFVDTASDITTQHAWSWYNVQQKHTTITQKRNKTQNNI